MLYRKTLLAVAVRGEPHAIRGPRCVLRVDIFYSATSPIGPGDPHYRGFMISLRRFTLGMTPVDE
jgi:hypothetical protein